MKLKNNKPTNIIFKNKPKLSEHEADSKFNEKRVNLIPSVEDFISSHPMFKGKEISVTFSHKGVSSLVSIIETVDQKLVFKIRLGGANVDEGKFLEVWEKAGVKVPHVFEEGILNEHAYSLMEYIDAPTLEEAFNKEELIEKGILYEMGSTLRTMHIPKTEGYGHLTDGKAKYTEFKDWLMSEYMQKKTEYVKENKLLNDEHGSLSDAREILINYINNKKSSYCHNDFGTTNIFATNPITVFDPDPVFNNEYIDLGRAITIRIANDGAFPQQLIDGYFKGEPYNKKVLQASILLNSYMKFAYWNRVKKIKQIQNIQKYLTQTEHLFYD